MIKKENTVDNRWKKSTSPRKKRSLMDALKPHKSLKIRYEEIEDLASYAGKLSPEDRNWLARFAEEYVHANLFHEGEVIHNTPKLRTAVYNKAYRNREELFSNHKAKGVLRYIEDLNHGITIEELPPELLEEAP